MNKKFIKLFICPRCKLNKLEVSLTISKKKKSKKSANEEILRCMKGHVFKINNGIPNFVINNKLESKIYDDIWKNNTLSKYKKKDIKLYKKKFQSFAKIKKLNLRNKLVLDAGCGEGRFSWLLGNLGAKKVVAVDFSNAALSRAKYQSANQSKIIFIKADLNNLPFKENTFDLVISFGVIHHNKYPEKLFHKLSKFTKLGGIFSIYLYRKYGMSFIQDMIRPITKKMNRNKLHYFCELCGFTVTPSKKMIVDIPNILKKVRWIDVLRINMITFEGLTSTYWHRFSVDEIKNWYKKYNFKIISFTRHISMSGLRLKK